MEVVLVAIVTISEALEAARAWTNASAVTRALENNSRATWTGVATGVAILGGGVAGVYKVYVAEVVIVVVLAVLVSVVSRVTRARGTMLFVSVTVRTHYKTVLVVVVEAVFAAFALKETNGKIGPS